MKRPWSRQEDGEIDEDKNGVVSPELSENHNVQIDQLIDDDNTDDSTCVICRGGLSNEGNVILNGKLVHSLCFKKRGVNQKEPSRQNSTSEQEISLVSQPAKFQIANYNIHPPPSLLFTQPFNGNATICVQLVDCSSGTVMEEGFQSGDTKFIRAGQNTIYFTSLKLNKMAPIKTELHFRNSKQMNNSFCLLFRIGETKLHSERFRIVSSCSQLPYDVRDQVRPKKPIKGLKQQLEKELTFKNPFHGLESKGNLYDEAKRARVELEAAIDGANVDLASKAAQKLAYLKHFESYHEMMRPNPQ